MSERKGALQEVLPKAGLVVSEKGNLTEILCKPKIMPLKSITLQKLEEMEAKAAEVSKQQLGGFGAPFRPSTSSQVSMAGSVDSVDFSQRPASRGFNNGI